MKIKQVSAIAISLLLLTVLTGCVSLVREPSSATSQPAQVITLSDTVKISGAQTPTLGLTGLLPTGWGTSKSTQDAKGVITPGGEVTPKHVLLFSKDKQCSFEVTTYFTDANDFERGDLFETKSLLYQQVNSANGKVKNETTVNVFAVKKEIQFDTAVIPDTATTRNGTSYTMLRVFSTKVSNTAGTGFPVIQGTYSCVQGVNVDAKVWAGLSHSLKLTVK